jgi:hypothetical protein
MVATCVAGNCGTAPLAAGTEVSQQVPGDCHNLVCDGTGGETNQIDDTDVPDDGNECTVETCVSGVPEFSNAPAGTACGGGASACDGAGKCGAVPSVALIIPDDESTPVLSVQVPTTITVSFTQPMDPATLVAQTASGPCTGSLQVSANGFATCAGFSSSTPAISSGGFTAAWTPAPGLLVNRTYQVRVTTAATTTSAIPLAEPYTSQTGFGTFDFVTPASPVVISQIYGGGGNAAATYKNDFIELHNVSAVAVDISGWSIQYAAASSVTWSVTPLLANASIPPNGFFLVQEFSGLSGAPLPTPDATGTVNLATGAGKVALVQSTTPLSGCPALMSPVVDLVGYGANANCSSGAPALGAGNNSQSLSRSGASCTNTQNNAADFTIGPAMPRNSSVTSACASGAVNETDSALEANFCAIDLPLSLSLQTGTDSGLVYGEIFESGVTEAVGASPDIIAELGFGPTTANPEYDLSWTWTTASYSAQAGNDDQYAASFTVPPAGTYRYAYRFSLDGGITWTYCDTTAGDGGAGSDAGLTFDLENTGLLTVTP